MHHTFNGDAVDSGGRADCEIKKLRSVPTTRLGFVKWLKFFLVFNGCTQWTAFEELFH